MITEVATEDAVWGCTTCGWCEEGCPVGIEHIQRIVDMRRYDVLMESRFPQEATGAFKGIENQGNPWGLAQEKRADWANGLEIPEMAELRTRATSTCSTGSAVRVHMTSAIRRSAARSRA